MVSTGTRLRLAEHTGTIRYAGPVDGTTGSWLGIEWDDPTRGKHDGVKDGKRYFTCRIPNSGSFIRPTSKEIIYGSSFLPALHAKYVEQLQGPQESVLLGSSNGAIQVEAVDLDKIRAKFANLGKLREVSLDTDFVSRYDGPEGSIRATCPNVRGLDLSTSLFSDWEPIVAICAELPYLERLSLNRTRLTLAKDGLTSGSFANLIELRLNAALATWDDIRRITSAMPALKTIEVGHNRIHQLAGSLQGSTLESINLDSNGLHDWNEICTTLMTCSSLDRVVLASNLITTIPLPPRGLTLGVRHLSLSHNRIATWRDVDSLSLWCPSLQTLTMLGNPLFDDPEHARSARQMTIARIPSLQALDAGAISSKERIDSELFYLSHIALHGPQSLEARVAAHPRWTALCEKHGRPDEPEITGHHQDTLSRRLIELNIFHSMTEPPVSAEGLTDRITLRALPTMTLHALRLKLCKTAKRRPGNTAVDIWLQMNDSENSYAILAEDRDTQDLAWLGIESGSNIVFALHDM
ncbi:CAP-Gly domain-containing protein [Mycena indigotica]|uniref:CAP-Gly domain-containing protein n=1 Tax=Mycena indigotica TaxID=2126181 RepID=A0A8H6S9L0_9AGAR|nr:CAP-Gly domain-containing protein [Mycena indigotica]KAF7295520.1 CAP-Gly domain-containing protein [Mycena indigotica]